MECSHVATAATLPQEVITKVRPNSWSCVVCRSHKKPWICLKCGVINCGRYVNGHAKRHAEENPGHWLCMDQGLTVYCYSHDEFVVNENETISSLRSEIEQNIKRSSSSPSSSEDTDKEDTTPPPRKLVKLENGRSCPVRTAGLQNLGNTCFMNSILQSLNNIEQFYGYFSKLPSLEPAHTNSSDHQYMTRRSSLEDVSLVEEVRKVSCGLWRDGDSSLSPDSLFSIVWRLVPQFRGYQQQDAHEFMRYLLDKLHTELLACGSSQEEGEEGEETSCDGGGGGGGGCKSTIVSQVFGGTLQSDVRCLACCTESRTHDPILDISLDIPDRFISRRKGERHQECSILDCLTSYTGLETLEETEWYYCRRCKTRRPSTKRLYLNTLPNVLCIHLKRFRFNSFVRTKISTPVMFPLSGLDVGQFTTAGMSNRGARLPGEKGSIYDLGAVVVHHGSGVSSGHYTAYAFSPKSGLWYHFNDSTVTETTPKRVESCRAYILFYVRRETSNGRYHRNSSDGGK